MELSPLGDKRAGALAMEVPVATVIAMTCPTCGLALANIDTDFLRNNAEDRAHHVHVQVADQVVCANLVTPHTWRISGELTLRPV